MLVGQPEVVDAEQVQNGRVEVVNVDAVGGHVVAQFIGRPVGDPWSDPAAGRPGGEASRVMVAARVVELDEPDVSLGQAAENRLPLVDSQAHYPRVRVLSLGINANEPILKPP